MNEPNAPEVGVRPAGFRLPEDTRVGRVRLQVSDLSRSLDFYARALGFRLIDRDGPTAHLGANGDDRVLLELRERPGARRIPRGGRLGIYHFALLLPDRADLGRFVRHQAESGVEFGAADHLFSEAVYLVDPDGITIEVYADRPRSTWTYRDHEFAVASNPLDFASVVRAGAGEPWQGMPPGATIGHVHLYIGDIARAEAFYHTALGFDKVIWSFPGALFVSAGGYHHHVGLNTWAAGAPVASEDDVRLLDWELIVPDAGTRAQAAASLEAHGIAVDRADDHVLARDPWGIAVRITAAP